MTLDSFIDQIRAAGGDAPEVQRLADVLRVVQMDDSPHAIADYGLVVRTLCHPALSLLERVQAIIAAMEGRQP